MNIDTGELTPKPIDGFEPLNELLSLQAGLRIAKGNTFVSLTENTELGKFRREQIMDKLGLIPDKRLQEIEERLTQLEDMQNRNKWLGESQASNLVKPISPQNDPGIELL